MSQEFCNQIATLSVDHFNTLPKKGKPNINQWTVLSCIIQENNGHFEVVALGTGSKCIGQSKMSPKGDIVNDSHAEIICRRAFLCYIYEELKLKNSVLFNFDSASCSLKETVQFHFFTSCVPCGDAAIFYKQNASEFGNLLKRSVEDEEVDTKRQKIDVDIYRTGAKCLPQSDQQDLHGSGSEYHTLGVVRTKPGRGDLTLSVSCSDKLARWCQVGIQGALLAQILKTPIHLSTLTIAGQTPFCISSLRRALYDRLDVNKSPRMMRVGQASVSFDFCKAKNKDPCPSSIIWFKSAKKSLEVGVDGFKQGATKVSRGTKAARLQISKIELFRSFLDTTSFLFGDVNRDVFYDDTKAKAEKYQSLWTVVKKECFKFWTIKNKSLQHFTID